ncbi:MAG: family transcriptional regulator [Deltaproteobacteria bacterium]|nr:family transcriptional regulator [Deltaproteobacteria bacterium]
MGRNEAQTSATRLAMVTSRGKYGHMETNANGAIRQNRVRELRENRLMTQAQLARKAKVALRTIHSVEKGMNCRMDTKRKILLALGMRFEDKDYVFPSLSDLSGEMPRPPQQPPQFS